MIKEYLHHDEIHFVLVDREGLPKGLACYRSMYYPTRVCATIHFEEVTCEKCLESWDLIENAIATQK